MFIQNYIYTYIQMFNLKEKKKMPYLEIRTDKLNFVKLVLK